MNKYIELTIYGRNYNTDRRTLFLPIGSFSLDGSILLHNGKEYNCHQSLSEIKKLIEKSDE